MERFDFAISFAGPQRTLARELTTALTARGYRVFFDELFEHDMLGKDGTEYLRSVYFRDANYCIALVSEEYDRRAWTRLEREAVQARELRDGAGFLIPVLVDGARPEWLLPSRIYFDLTERRLDDLVRLLARKVDGGLEYKRVAQFENVFGQGPIGLSRIDGADTFLVRCQYSKSSEYAKELTREHSEWVLRELTFSVRGRHVCPNETTVFVVREPWEGPPFVLDRRTGERALLQPPRSYKWDMITTCARNGDETLFGYCGGDVWLYRQGRLYEVRPGVNDVLYAQADFFGDAIVCGSDQEQTIDIRARDGEVLRSFSVQDVTMGIAGFAAEERIVVGGGHSITILTGTGEVVHSRDLPAQGVFEFGSAREGGVCAYLCGFGSGNVVEAIDIKNGRRLYNERSAVGTDWYSLAISSDGNNIVLSSDNDVTILQRA